MNKKLAQKAIKSALSGEWNTAVELNSKLLDKYPDDIPTMNRLARAYAALGKMDKAKKVAENVLSHEADNKIAKKILEKLELSKDKETFNKPSPNERFLQEPGKTKLVPLINIGDDKVVNRLSCGEKVNMRAQSHHVSIYTDSDKYIGRLPDDIAARVKKLMEHGNQYNTCIKTSEIGKVTVFIREVKRSKKLENIPSFTKEKIDYISFS